MSFDIAGISKSQQIRPRVGDQPQAAQQRQPQAVPANDTGIMVEAKGDLAADMAPIDTKRVQVIRQAIEEGSYPVLPAKIADAMIAARLFLSTSA